MKTRLDRLLVERGLAESREKAQALIMAGEVLSTARRHPSPASRWPPIARSKCWRVRPTSAAADSSWRPRSTLRHRRRRQGVPGYRLFHRRLHRRPAAGRRGARARRRCGRRPARLEAAHRSARGGARRHQRARADASSDIGERVDFLTCDVSFISVTLILPAVAPLLQPGGQMVILVKPQFEVGKGQVGKGGIVRDPQLHQAACERVTGAVREFGIRHQHHRKPHPRRRREQGVSPVCPSLRPSASSPSRTRQPPWRWCPSCSNG